LRLNDERALYGLADDDDRPDPANARTASEFVALLGALVDQSGLSLAEIEELARSKGYVLPEQIIATVLDNDALPPEELVVALVRSIGINDREVKYWMEVLWRLESRTVHDPAQTDQEHERRAPRDIEQIYGAKDERGSSAPYVVSPAFEATRRPARGIDPYLDPAGDAASAAAGFEAVEHDEPYVEAEPVSPAASRAVQERGKRSSRTGMHRLARDDEDGRADDAHAVEHYETGDDWVVRPERPRLREFAARSLGRDDRNARWPLPVAIGLAVVLAGSVVAWMAIGGSGGEAPPNVAGAPPGSTQNKAGTVSQTTGGSPSPTAGDGGMPSGAPEVPPGTDGNPPVNPNNPNNPNPQPTTQGPQPTSTQPRSYNTQLNGTGSTTCTSEGGQWRVRILVNVTVTDPPPGLNPQGQAGLSGSMQGFSLSGSGTSYSGSTTVSVGPSSSTNVGTVQWVVTMSVPGGRIARDESFEGYSCA
jgi:hypothetical protein